MAIPVRSPCHSSTQTCVSSPSRSPRPGSAGSCSPVCSRLASYFAASEYVPSGCMAFDAAPTPSLSRSRTVGFNEISFAQPKGVRCTHTIRPDGRRSLPSIWWGAAKMLILAAAWLGVNIVFVAVCFWAASRRPRAHSTDLRRSRSAEPRLLSASGSNRQERHCEGDTDCGRP